MQAMSKKLKVYCRISSNADCGVGYYRQWLPLVEAERQGLVELRVQHFTWGEQQGEGKEIPVSETDFLDNCRWADVVYFSRNDTPVWLAYALMQKDLLGKPCLVDYDDLVHATRPVNPGYRSFHPNSEYNKFNIEAFKYYDGLTVSTDYLEQYYRKYTKKIYILPNSMDMKDRDYWATYDYSDSPTYKKEPNEIRLGWSGSASHWENLSYIAPVIIDIMKNHDNVTFYMTGLFGDDLWVDAPDNVKARIHKVPFVPLKEYGKMLNSMHLDIGLAPLTDCEFNRAKSNLRLLEYGATKIATVASDVHPYRTLKNEVQLCTELSEWYMAIEKLIVDKSLREQYATKLYNKVKKDYTVEKNCLLWVKALTDLVTHYGKQSSRNTGGRAKGKSARKRA